MPFRYRTAGRSPVSYTHLDVYKRQILARTLGIPAVVGVDGLLERCTPGALVLVDGDAGRAVLSPDAETLTRFTGALRADAAHRARMEASARRPAATRDGRPVAVRANTGDCESLRALEMDACDGIGLFRTEFLFLGRSCAPTEDEQFAVYREAVTRAGGKEVIIRTLDVGGDKQASYMGLPAEANPFLGLRGIRVCLERPELFRTQLRAILRLSLIHIWPGGWSWTTPCFGRAMRPVSTISSPPAGLPWRS